MCVLRDWNMRKQMVVVIIADAAIIREQVKVWTRDFDRMMPVQFGRARGLNRRVICIALVCFEPERSQYRRR